MSTRTRELTPWAATAKEIRKELRAKWPNVRFRVRSESFAGGSAVDIYWTDGPTREQVRDVVGKYEYGYFDGMTDCYYITNRRDDIPQVKFVQLHRKLSPARMIKLLRRVGIEAEEEELEKTDPDLMDKWGVWTLEQLAWQLEHTP